VNIALNGLKRVNASGRVTVLQGNKPEDTNSIIELKKIAPVTTAIKWVSSHFTRTVPPYSISFFQLYK
jgi:alpha-L-arabinofuranosidase